MQDNTQFPLPEEDQVPGEASVEPAITELTMQPLSEEAPSPEEENLTEDTTPPEASASLEEETLPEAMPVLDPEVPAFPEETPTEISVPEEAPASVEETPESAEEAGSEQIRAAEETPLRTGEEFMARIHIRMNPRQTAILS